MRKKGLMIFSLLMICIFITACGKSKSISDVNELLIQSKDFGSIKLKYSKDKHYSISTQEDDDNNYYYEIYNHDHYMNMNVHIEYVLKEYYDDLKKAEKESKGFKEYNWNGNKGFSFGNQYSLSFITIINDKSELFYEVLRGDIYLDSDKSAITIFNSSDIQSLMETMEYIPN